MKKFNRKRLAGLLASWCALAGAIWWLSYQETHVCIFGFLLLFSLTSLLSLYLLWRPIRAVTAAVVGGVLLLAAPEPSRAQGEPPWLTECALFLVVVGVGVVIVVGLVRTCQRCLPPETPPEQPPCPPATNSPPITNAQPRKATLTLTDQSMAFYDVSSMTLSNTDSHGNPYHVWFHGTVQSSTNLNHWKNEYTINGWASGTEVLTLYSIDGAPVLTNRSDLGGTNYVEMPSVTADEPTKFFRVIP